MKNAIISLDEKISKGACVSPFDPILDSEIIKISKIRKSEYKYYIENSILEKSLFLSESRHDLFKFHNIWDLIEFCMILKIKTDTGINIFEIKNFASQIVHCVSMSVSDEILSKIDIMLSLKEEFAFCLEMVSDICLKNYLHNNEYEIFFALEYQIDRIIKIINSS